MRFLVIGLGSMGKRRVRNLLALGNNEIAGWDIREDRRKDAEIKYGIKLFDNFEETLDIFKPEVFLISVNPEMHMNYAHLALEKNIHCFIEASVTEAEKIYSLYELNKEKKLILAPSCTMQYFHGPQKIGELLKQKVIGDLLFINYHSGQYLVDWHPWESIKDYYVSKKETGACREIVPFELTWMNKILGEPRVISLTKDKLTDMETDIDDIYNCVLRYNKVICNLIVDVIARPKAVREFRALGSEGILEWSYENNWVRYSNVKNPEWNIFNLGEGSIESGYINPEEPYINEIKDFINAIQKNDPSLFPNSLLNDYRILQTLYKLESLNKY